MANFVIFRCVYRVIFFKTSFIIYYCIADGTKFEPTATKIVCRACCIHPHTLSSNTGNFALAQKINEYILFY